MSEIMTTVKPILFSGPMIRSLVEGRKTQTRRVLRPQPADNIVRVDNSLRGPHWRDAIDADGGYENADWIKVPCAPSDLLWVRETIRYDWGTAAWSYDADQVRLIGAGGRTLEIPTSNRWPLGVCVSMFMPRWASRLTLEVTAVKVERLQEISEEDAKAEGIETDQSGLFLPVAWRNYAYDNHPFKSAVASFRSLWDSLNAKRGYAWEANPWVCAIAFNVHKMNVDAFLAQREAA